MYMGKPRHTQISTCPCMFLAMSYVSMTTEQISELGSPQSVLLSAMPLLIMHHLKDEKGRGDIYSPGICMPLELLFDVPEEVVLGKEKRGTQGQELPALPGKTDNMG